MSGRVLVIDAEKGSREALRLALMGEHPVWTAADAPRARMQLAARSPEVAILDPALAGGEALLAELRAEHPQTALILVTGRASLAGATRALRHDAVDYLAKPWDLVELRAAMTRALARRRPDRARLLELLTATVEAQHPSFAGHARRTAVVAGLLAERLGLRVQESEHVRLAALLHDVGKVGVPGELLLRPGALAPDERARVDEHAAIGARLVAPLGLDPAVGDAVRHHHERWDGAGHPGGLAGEAIPLTARILALADAFDAMSSDRPYRRALAPDRVRIEIERCAGSQFDPALAKEFLWMLEATLTAPELLADAVAAVHGRGFAG